MQFARIQGGLVAELFTPPEGVPLADCFHPDLAAQFVPVPPGSAPQPGWSAAQAGGAWAFAAPAAPPPPSLAQRAASLQAAGLAVTSASTPALNDTYACDATMQAHISAEMLAVLVNGAFADGGATLDWPNAAGTAAHTFPSPAAFKPFALAVAAFVAACAKVQLGTSGTLPSATAAIP